METCECGSDKWIIFRDQDTGEYVIVCGSIECDFELGRFVKDETPVYV